MPDRLLTASEARELVFNRFRSEVMWAVRMVLAEIRKVCLTIDRRRSEPRKLIGDGEYIYQDGWTYGIMIMRFMCAKGEPVSWEEAEWIAVVLRELGYSAERYGNLSDAGPTDFLVSWTQSGSRGDV